MPNELSAAEREAIAEIRDRPERPAPGRLERPQPRPTPADEAALSWQAYVAENARHGWIVECRRRDYRGALVVRGRPREMF